MDVFISYSRKDRAAKGSDADIISQIQEAFKVNGISYWLDEEGIHSGETFASVISRNIAESKIFLFISSIHSNASKWTCGEVATASSFDKKIIPFRIDDTPYDSSVTIYLAALDSIDGTTNPSKAIRRLIKAIRVYLDEMEAESTRIEEQKRWLAEQERLFAEKEKIRAENESVISSLSLQKDVLEEKIKVIDSQLDEILKDKTELLGKIKAFLIRISDLRAGKDMPLDIDGYSEDISESEEETLPKTKNSGFGINNRGPFLLLVIAVLALLMGGIAFLLFKTDKDHNTIQEDEPVIWKDQIDTTFIQNGTDSLWKESTEVVSLDTERDKPSSANQDEEISKAEILPVIQQDFEKEIPKKEGNIREISFLESTYEVLEVDQLGGIDTVAIVFPTNIKQNKLIIKKSPEWCIVEKINRGGSLRLDYRPYNDSTYKKTINPIGRISWKPDKLRDGDIILAISNKEFILHLLQDNCFKGKESLVNPYQNSKTVNVDSLEEVKGFQLKDSLLSSKDRVSSTPALEKAVTTQQDNVAIVEKKGQDSSTVTLEKTQTQKIDKAGSTLFKTLSFANGAQLKIYKVTTPRGESFMITEPIKNAVWKAVMNPRQTPQESDFSENAKVSAEMSRFISLLSKQFSLRFQLSDLDHYLLTGDVDFDSSYFRLTVE